MNASKRIDHHHGIQSSQMHSNDIRSHIELSTIQTHLSNQRAKVGARQNSATRQMDVMLERKIQITKEVGDLADADLSKLITELQSLVTSQEASQKAFVKISQLNLFDYMS